jgi:hypothetical protein
MATQCELNIAEKSDAVATLKRGLSRRMSIMSVASLKSTYRHAVREVNLLNMTLRSCEWCCGGGNERRMTYRRTADAARVRLLTLGVKPEDVPPLCRHCFYYDADEPECICKKCLGYLGGKWSNATVDEREDILENAHYTFTLKR